MSERNLNTLTLHVTIKKKHHFSALRERMQTANEKVIENFGFETLNVHGTSDNRTDVSMDFKLLYTTA